MKKTRKKLICLLVALTLVVATFSACGGSGGGVEGDVAEGAADASTADAGAADASGGSAASAGGVTDTTVRIGISGTPDLDPAIASTASSTQAMANLYDTLVYTPADGTIENRLAESWEVSDDGLAYTFKLVEGALFHDGSEVMADDVAFSMDRFIAIGEGYSYVFSDAVASSEATGDYEVTFTLNYPYGAFVSSLVRLAVLNKDLIMENIDESGTYGEFGDYGKAWLVTNDAGSGPYMYGELVQQDYFHADKFDDWFMGWDDRSNAPTAFRMLNVQEASTVRTMMNTREMEITDPWQSNENLEAMSQIEGVEISKTNTFLEQNLYLNTTKAPFDDVNFRRAFLCLIDYDSIINDIIIGSELSTGPVAAGVTGQVECNVASYDLDQAREYIAQSAYADNYQDYPLEMMVNTDVADMEKIALLIHSAAAQLDISIEISKAPWVSIVDRMATAESTPHLFSANSAPAYNDAGTYLEARFSSKNNGSWEQGEWLGDTALDQMIADALATSDEADRFSQYADIQNYIVDDVAATGYLYDLSERFAYQSSYVSIPDLENADGGILRSLYGYNFYFADMEIFPDQKPE